MFKAPPERVFRAWSDPKVLVKWWGTDDYQTPDPQIDFRVGGAWRSAMVGPKGEAHTVSGVYREIEPPKRLVMTWGWEQADGSRGHETVVEVTLRASARRHADAAGAKRIRESEEPRRPRFRLGFEFRAAGKDAGIAAPDAPTSRVTQAAISPISAP